MTGNQHRASVCLASQSKARLALLEQLGVKPVVRPMDVDESRQANEVVSSYVERLALVKAGAAYELESRSDLRGLPALGADTVIYHREQVLTKPAGTEDAIRMLEMLSGSTHQVYTGTAIVNGSGAKSCVVETAVTFATLSHREICDYVATGEPFGKAGAYAIQGLGGSLVQHIAGSYSNVVGLPLYEVRDLLGHVGILPLRA